MTILISAALSFFLAFALALGLTALGAPVAVVLGACFVLGALVGLIVLALA